ncbi:IclR family transcriptional regulator [Rubellicoccus peritrichatus]|uniref:IclR family transcriptional regulator n=1 Tax=Rubellicoccus peritrichatus TaxID=3080537 RepID=A0AAQ3L855_9BACT|nr:IclR family transcriptional regulator [Puniceicoccus sp. CR14]WOO40851.1 IclR family transcriptional regulator [Puniceicoccus sp. CR14]
MNNYSIPNLKNACLAIKRLADEETGLSIAELVEELEVPRTSMLRIVSTLEEEGFLRRSGRKYQLGTTMLAFGLTALKESNIREVARPMLKDLSLATSETSHIAQLAGKQILIMEVCDSPHPVRAASRAGTLADVHCSATGKVLLAYTVSDLADFFDDMTLTRRTANTITTLPDLAKEVEQTRQQGFGVDNEEYTIGVRCLAAPVRNAVNDVVAAIGITASVTTFTQRRIKEISEIVTATAQELSSRLGAS